MWGTPGGVQGGPTSLSTGALIPAGPPSPCLSAAPSTPYTHFGGCAELWEHCGCTETPPQTRVPCH